MGGILRDVFTMGARPVALLNSLRFGAPEHPKTRHLVDGVVAGIGGYGNCIGVPTVGGEATFHRAYDGNILVNAMCVGRTAGRDLLRARRRPGQSGGVRRLEDRPRRHPRRDHGIGGVLRGGRGGARPCRSATRSPSCCSKPALELMQTDAIVAIQDMGAAGLTSSSFEMAARGSVGIELDLDRADPRSRHDAL